MLWWQVAVKESGRAQSAVCPGWEGGRQAGRGEGIAMTVCGVVCGGENHHLSSRRSPASVR